MLTRLASRYVFLTLDADRDATQLIDTFIDAPVDDIAIEVDVGALARAECRHALQSAIALGIEITARIPPSTEIDRDVIARLRASSCRSVSIGLDGHDAATHDGYHGCPGVFAGSVRALETAKHLGFKLTILSAIHRGNAAHLERMSTLPRWLAASAWFVSFSCQPGLRGRGHPLSLSERMRASAQLHEISQRHRQAIGIRCADCCTQGPLPSATCVDPEIIATAVPGIHAHPESEPITATAAEIFEEVIQ